MGVLKDLPPESDLEGPGRESNKKGKEASCLQEARLEPSRRILVSMLDSKKNDHVLGGLWVQWAELLDHQPHT